MSKQLKALVVAVTCGLALLLAAPSAPTAPLPRIPVVAAENFYGDIVLQLAGGRVSIISIMSDPNVDPHAYETNAKDAAAIADARLVIRNGLGYDTFIDHLLAASPNPRRTVIVVAALTGHKEGDNPHLWYAPSTMPKVARAVVDALSQADPQNAAFYRARHRMFQESLQPLTRTVARLHDRHLGAPIAVTEPVFDYMARALGLHVLTPEAFQKAIEDGVDPPAAALAQMEDQLKKRQVRVLVYNTQTVSSVTRRLRQLADELSIPVVGVSETEPPGKSYLQWMVGQLEQLDAALSKQR
ncbi:MAG TPA: zinc ABC transporter substrate-binding protein [bacterium]|nr:zinc ABC transporter substrate-binding protein [bacterium]